MKKRLDILIVERGLISSRKMAQALIMASKIEVNGNFITKAGQMVPETADIIVKDTDKKFVSRGGMKLIKAINEFSIDVNNKMALDIGASTGGFTDCLLKHGASKVYAIDVGYGQLEMGLRNDPRVVNFERTNARYFEDNSLKNHFDICVIDVSFISIEKILRNISDYIKTETGELITLIKPQFEAGPKQVEKGGVIRDPKIHIMVAKKVIEEIINLGFELNGVIFSPIKGPAGNIEFLAYFKKSKIAKQAFDLDLLILKLVNEAHEYFNV